MSTRPSRRAFLATTAATAAGLAGACGPSPSPGPAQGTTDAGQGFVGDGRKRRILLQGGVVLSLDPRVGDFEKADVLIDGTRIAAVAPTVPPGDAEIVDCTGTIVMPGFVTTHHHQYETLQRSMIPDGLLAGAWPQESYQSVVQAIWTAGRIADPARPGQFVWDLGRVPYDPEDCYISQLVACLSEITEGVTTGTDTSQANHTPAHTDAMIQGMKDSGRRCVFDYSGGIDRSADGIPFEFPGAMGDGARGIGRLAATHFSSKDQLLTLGLAGSPGPAFPGASYTGWQLARSVGALVSLHNVANPGLVIGAAADPRNGTDWSDVTFIHATRWEDAVGAPAGTPPALRRRSRAWEICRDRGAHASIAVLIEMQMRHGMPPFQMALDHGILPSLSPDVDTNMTTDPFSLMRGAFCLQRALASELAFPENNPDGLPVPTLVTSRQVIEMATIAGAAANRLLDKVGTLTPGKEADIVVLDARSINTWPMNNVPGTVVTMMNPRHVRDTIVAGRVLYRNGSLVGWDVPQLLTRIEQARDRVLARINGPAKVGALPAGLNSASSNPYRPNFLESCCARGQTPGAREYVLRP